VSDRRRLFVFVVGGAALVACAAAVPYLGYWIEEERCLRALDGPDWSEAAETLGRLECARAVPGLFALLPSDTRVDLRDHPAGRALLRIGKPAFLFALSKLPLDDYLRAWRLLECLPPSQVPLLIAAADDPRVELRAAIGRLLTYYYDDPAVVAAHLRLLADRNEDVRLGAINGVSFAKEPPDEFAPALLALLRDPKESDGLRRAACLGVSCLRPAIAVPALREELRNTEPLVRRIAARALGELKEKSREAVPRLEELLRDPDAGVRKAVLVAFEGIGATMACLEPAIELLESDEEETGVALLAQLGPGAAPAVPALIAELQERPPGSRTSVIHALGRMGPAASAAVPLLERELADEKSNAREWVAEALGRIGPAALKNIDLLVKLGLRDEPDGCREGLSLLGQAAVPAVIRALESRDAALMSPAARFLGGLGPLADQAVPALTAALTENDPELVEDVVWAIGRIGPAARSAVPGLVALLGRNPEDRDERERELIAEALGRIGVRDDPVPALLCRLARSDHGELNPHALLALGRLGIRDEDVVRLLKVASARDDQDYPLTSYFSAHALLHLGVHDESIEAALGKGSTEEYVQFGLRVHTGFPDEVKQILPRCAELISEGESNVIALVARLLAEVGPDARSVLPALQKARVSLLKQKQYWAEGFVDSGGSHMERGLVANALQAVEAAIASVSGGNTSGAQERLSATHSPGEGAYPGEAR
jgi:HEAT repeat protein